MTTATFICRQCGHRFKSPEGDLICPTPWDKRECPRCGGTSYKIPGSGFWNLIRGL